MSAEFTQCHGDVVAMKAVNEIILEAETEVAAAQFVLCTGRDGQFLSVECLSVCPSLR